MLIGLRGVSDSVGLWSEREREEETERDRRKNSLSANGMELSVTQWDERESEGEREREGLYIRKLVDKEESNGWELESYNA